MTALANGLSARDTETVMRALHTTARPAANMQRHVSASMQKKRSGERNEATLRNVESSQAVGSLRRRGVPAPQPVEKDSPGLSRAAALDFQSRPATGAARTKSLAAQGFLCTERWPRHWRKRDVNASKKWPLPLFRQPQAYDNECNQSPPPMLMPLPPVPSGLYTVASG